MIDNAEEMLAQICERLRELPDAVDAAMPEVARVMHDYLREQIAAGVDPDTGKPWALTKDGRPPKLKGKTLKVGVDGRKVIASLRGPDAYHTMGIARGGKERRLLPKGVTPELARRIGDVMGRAIHEALIP